MLEHGLAESTRAAYRTGERSFIDFCNDNGIVNLLPASPDTLCLWIASLQGQVTANTIRNYLIGVRSLHIDSGLPDPTGDPRIARIISGIRREQLEAGDAPLRSLPITPSMVTTMARHLDQESYVGAMFLAALFVASAGCLRIGEFARPRHPHRQLRVRHVTLYPQGVSVYLPSSKTDQFGNGSFAYIAHAPAVEALLHYLDIRAAIWPHDASNEPLFMWPSGKALGRRRILSVTERLLNCCEYAGELVLPPYFGVSFRAGGATALAQSGASETAIKALGRWRSDAYRRYVRSTPAELLASAASM